MNRPIQEAMDARLRLERELRQMQKLDALGRVAANLGHEINNPLAYIRCNLDYLKERLRAPGPHDGDDLFAVVEEADAGVERIRLLVQELRAFSRKDDDDASSAPSPSRSISVQSTVARGTTFRVALPVFAGPRPQALAPPLPPVIVPGPCKGRVLLVDDEPQFLRSLKRVLRNFEVEIASGVDAAMALYRDHPFDVVVCDLNMPGRTGRDLHEELARLGPDHAERVIFMTGGAFHEWAHAFLARTSNPYVEKPMTARAVSDVIEGHLGVLRARDLGRIAAR